MIILRCIRRQGYTHYTHYITSYSYMYTNRLTDSQNLGQCRLTQQWFSTLVVGLNISQPEVHSRADMLISSPMKMYGRRGSKGTYIQGGGVNTSAYQQGYEYMCTRRYTQHPLTLHTTSLPRAAARRVRKRIRPPQKGHRPAPVCSM